MDSLKQLNLKMSLKWESQLIFREDKMKKIIITITIISFMNLIGCYYQKQMNPSDFNFDDEEDVQIMTKDTTYNLSGKDYYYDNDTVFATLRTKLNAQSTLKTNIEIPVKEIKTVEVERTNTLLTILSGLGIVLGVLFLAVWGSYGFTLD